MSGICYNITFLSHSISENDQKHILRELRGDGRIIEKFAPCCTYPEIKKMIYVCYKFVPDYLPSESIVILVDGYGTEIKHSTYYYVSISVLDEIEQLDYLGLSHLIPNNLDKLCDRLNKHEKRILALCTEKQRIEDELAAFKDNF